MDQMCIDGGIGEMGCSLISGILYLAYFLFGLALIAGIVLPLVKSLQSPKELLRSAAGVLVLVVVFLVAYILSGDEVTLTTASYGITPEKSKIIGGGIITLYIVFFAAIAGLAFSMINNAIKGN